MQLLGAVECDHLFLFFRTLMILDTDFVRVQICSDAKESYETWNSDPGGCDL